MNSIVRSFWGDDSIEATYGSHHTVYLVDRVFFELRLEEPFNICVALLGDFLDMRQFVLVVFTFLGKSLSILFLILKLLLQSIRSLFGPFLFLLQLFFGLFRSFRLLLVNFLFLFFLLSSSYVSTVLMYV